uniref:Uncharacterized protein n=1 Tax=Arion vulgaris TaxID=1028688 RepID=A0A0B7AVW5_9EUPU
MTHDRLTMTLVRATLETTTAISSSVEPVRVDNVTKCTGNELSFSSVDKCRIISAV